MRLDTMTCATFVAAPPVELLHTVTVRRAAGAHPDGLTRWHDVAIVRDVERDEMREAVTLFQRLFPRSEGYVLTIEAREAVTTGGASR